LCEARERLKVDSLSRNERNAYYRHLDNVVILRDNIYTERAEGRMEGREEGRAEGRAEVIHEQARRMKDKGYPTSDIAEITGLPVEEIEKL